jgi:hypothetical protein
LVAPFVVTVPARSHPRRIDASLTIAKAFQGFRAVEASLQGCIKVDGTFV